MFIITHLHNCSTYKREKGRAERRGTHAGSQSEEEPTQDLPQTTGTVGRPHGSWAGRARYCALHVHVHTVVRVNTTSCDRHGSF